MDTDGSDDARERQVVEREFRNAQEQVRQVADRLRAALAEDERRTKPEIADEQETEEGH